MQGFDFRFKNFEFNKDDFRYTYDINNYLNKPNTNSEDSWVYCGVDKPQVEVIKPTRELSLKEHAKVNAFKIFTCIF